MKDSCDVHRGYSASPRWLRCKKDGKLRCTRMGGEQNAHDYDSTGKRCGVLGIDLALSLWGGCDAVLEWSCNVAAEKCK